MTHKSIPVALVEQLGAVLYMALYMVLAQHILTAHVWHRPEESWISKGIAAYQNWKLERELAKFSAFRFEMTAEEPSPRSEP